ncbi:MAG TPA: DUF3604 domain-containing protein [Gammaproteobacteria bacterium]|nr:DUF3604 domain-containing protein [Gammaproteobacteria bacterium]HIL97431.1 DUF3604 domain-containing protein [Pseudomonadales bacterium]
MDIEDGINLHSKVIIRDKQKAHQITPMSNDDSSDPEDSWKCMAGYEERIGDRALAIAISIGSRFTLQHGGHHQHNARSYPSS